MGDAEGQSGLAPFVLFLDENHHRNRHLLQALATAGVECEKHLDHFATGTEDTAWLPAVAAKGWCLLTTDARIRYNFLEREAVRTNSLRMFYFPTNNLGGVDMGKALAKALPQMQKMASTQPPPFIASISKNGEVSLRNTFPVNSV